MTEKTYMVCDMYPVLEQANENTIVYVREISPADVQPVRIAQREYQTMGREHSICLEKERRKLKRRKNKISLDEHLTKLTASLAGQFSNKRQEIERGTFAGLYLVQDFNPTLPEIGFTYDKIPNQWERLEYPTDSAKLVGSQTTLGEFLTERLWNLDK